MRVAALAVTLVGFVLLIVALITSSIAFAWACIVVCLIGFGLLIADVLGVRKGGKASSGGSTKAKAESAVAADPAAPVETVTTQDASVAESADVPAAEAFSAPATEALSEPATESISEPVAEEAIESSVVRESEHDR